MAKGTVHVLKFWAELVAAFGAVASIIISILKPWSIPAMPAWVGVSAIAAAGLLGFLLGNRGSRQVECATQGAATTFDYRDFFPLEERGWKVRGDEGVSPEGAIEPREDRRFGPVVGVDLPRGVYLQRALPEACRTGREIEFVGQMGIFYVRVLAQPPSLPNTSHVWLQFSPGDGAPRPVGATEWAINVPASGDVNGLPVYRIDVTRAFSETFARSGLGLVQITDFRFRGRSLIARITISATTAANRALHPTPAGATVSRRG